jgi:large subunit ribosomal protein L25
MAEPLLELQIREHRGSKCARRLRQQGRIPAVIYGHKQDAVSVSVDSHDFNVSLHHHGHRLFDAELDGRREKLLVKAIQYDYLGKDIIHIDLMRVALTEKVRVKVPLVLKGTAKGTHEGGIIQEHIDRLEVECCVVEIPDVIVVVVREVGVGDVLHACDIPLPAGVSLVTNPDTLVVTCGLVAAAKTTEEMEAAAPVAPEVIGKEAAAAEEAKEAEGKQ